MLVQTWSDSLTLSFTCVLLFKHTASHSYTPLSVLPVGLTLTYSCSTPRAPGCPGPAWGRVTRCLSLTSAWVPTSTRGRPCWPLHRPAFWPLGRQLPVGSITAECVARQPSSGPDAKGEAPRHAPWPWKKLCLRRSGRWVEELGRGRRGGQKSRKCREGLMAGDSEGEE